MEEGPRRKSEFTLLLEKMIDALILDPESMTFSLDQEKNCIVLHYKKGEEIITTNLTEILKNADLNHIILNNDTLAMLSSQSVLSEHKLQNIEDVYKNYYARTSLERYALSPFESNAIMKYVINSNRINYFLREQYKNISSLNHNDIKELLIIVLAMASGLNKMPPSNDEVLYRGERQFSEWEYRKAELKKGNQPLTAYSSFMSTTFDSAAEVCEQGELLILSHLSGRDLNTNKLGHADEKEVLAISPEIQWTKIEKKDKRFVLHGREVRPLYSEKERHQKQQFNASPEYQKLNTAFNVYSKTLHDNWCKYEKKYISDLFRKIQINFNVEHPWQFTPDVLGYLLLEAIHQGDALMCNQLLNVSHINLDIVDKNNKTPSQLIAESKFLNKDFLINKINWLSDRQIKSLRSVRSPIVREAVQFLYQQAINGKMAWERVATYPPEFLGHIVREAAINGRTDVLEKFIELNVKVDLEVYDEAYYKQTARELIISLNFNDKDRFIKQLDANYFDASLTHKMKSEIKNIRSNDDETDANEPRIG